MNGMRTLLVVSLIFALTGCGPKLRGTYHQTAGGGMTLEFKLGKVYSSVLGQTNEGTYKVKGDQVILHLKGEGDVTLKLNSDGTTSTVATNGIVGFSGDGRAANHS